MQPGRHPGRQLTAHGGGAHQNGRGPQMRHRVGKGGGVHVQPEVPQGGLVVYQHPVRAPVGQFFRRGFYSVPQEQRVYWMPDFRGQLPGLAQQLKGYGVQRAFHMIRIDQDAPPSAFVHLGRGGVLHHFRGPGGAFFHAQAAHFATGGGLYGVTVHFDGAEGTQRRKGGLVRDKLGMENQLCHFSALPATAFVPSAGRTAARPAPGRCPSTSPACGCSPGERCAAPGWGNR